MQNRPDFFRYRWVSLVSFLVGFFYFCWMDYRITQFLGKPHGPLSFADGSSVSNVCPTGLGAVVGVAVGPVDASFAAPDPAPFTVVVPAVGAAAVAPSSSFSFCWVPSFVVPSSHAKLTLLTAFQKAVPCFSASSSSLALGCLLPSAPENVPAPQGLPPRASLRSAKRGKVVA